MQRQGCFKLAWCFRFFCQNGMSSSKSSKVWAWKSEVKRWTPRLKAAIEQGSDSGLQNVRYVFTNKHEALITANVLRHWYRAAKDQAAQAYPKLVLGFTFHDIKAKSISYYEKGDKQEFSGHTTKSQMENNNRETSIVGSHD